MTQPRTKRGPGEKVRAPLERREVIGWIVVLLAGLVWGAAFRRTAPLSEVRSILPTVVIAVGPGLLLAFLAFRAVTGSFALRATGGAALLAVVGAVAGNVMTPGLAPSIDVTGRVKAGIDGTIIDTQVATCRWGPGRDRVISVRFPLDATSSVPAGTVVTDLVSGAINVLVPAGGQETTLVLAVGPAAVTQTAGAGERPADNRTGDITIDPATGGSIAGRITWECDAPPGE
jgi:hypothetical protein